MTKLYKIVGTEFQPLHGGTGKWFPPKGAKPGEWMPKIARLHVGNLGYHLIPAKAIVEWLPSVAAYLCEAEGRGASDSDGDKTAFAEARLLKIVGLLDEISMRLAAADMAERVLPIFCKMRPKDNRPALAIQAARDFALGKIDAAVGASARTAVGAAAWDAVGAAAWDAARTAVGAAAWDAARTAAGDAARAAAWATAWDAARDATRDANAMIIIACARQRLKEVA